MEVKGIVAGKGVLATMLLKEAPDRKKKKISGTTKVRGDEQESGIRRMRRDESAQQDKVLYPL
jgi:hypothetical protein